MNKIIVTGGNGFLGKAVTKSLSSEGRVFALGSKEYDLRCTLETKRMYLDLEPNVVVHLAATVGGIGATKITPDCLLKKT